MKRFHPWSFVGSLDRLGISKLTGNAGIYVFGNMLTKALNFLLIPLYTRFLTPADFGITGVMIALGGVLETILSFGIYAGVARYYFEYRAEPKQLKSYLTTNFVFLAIISGAAVLIIQLAGEPVWLWIAGSDIPFTPYASLMLWGTFAAVLLNIPLVLYQNEGRATVFIVANGAALLLNIGSTILFVVTWRMGAKGQLLGRLVGGGVTALILSLLFFRRYFATHWRWEYLRVSFLYGLPLIPHALSTWAITYADRLILERTVSLAELGLYNLANQVSIVMAVLVVSINSAWSPYYFDLMKSNPSPEPRVRQVTSLYVGIVSTICMVFILFSREVLFWVTPEEYHLAATYVPFLLVSYLLTGYYYFASMPLFFFKKTSQLPAITVTAAIANIVLNLWWTPKWGALGATWATVIAVGLMFGLSYIIGRRLQKVGYPLGQYAILTAVIILAAFMTTYGPLLQISINVMVWKFSLFVVFGLLAFRWLIGPNLKGLVLVGAETS